MKKLRNLFLIMISSLSMAFWAGFAFADTAAATTVTSSSTTGLIAALSVAVPIIIGIFNVVMSGVTQIFVILKKSEPQWAVTLGTIGLHLAQWISGNTNTPQPPSSTSSTS